MQTLYVAASSDRARVVRGRAEAITRCAAWIGLALTSTCADVAQAFGTDAAWATGFGLPDGCNGAIEASTSDNGLLFIGGAFSVCGNAVARAVARYDPATRSWSNVGEGSSALGGSARVIAVAGTRVFVAGRLTVDGGPEGERLLEYNAQSGNWTPPGDDPGNGLGCVDPCVEAMASTSESLFVGGRFDGVGFTWLGSVARFDLASNRWSALGEGSAIGVDGAVHALAVSGDQLLVGGYFERAGATAARNLALYDIASNEWSALGGGEVTGVDRGIAAVAIDDYSIYIGGMFRLPGASNVSALARFDRAQKVWTAIDLAAGSDHLWRMDALALGNGALFATGTCRDASSSVACSVRAGSGTGSAQRIGESEPIRQDRTTRTIEVLANSVYVGGQFARLHGASANGIVELPIGSGAWRAVGDGSGLGLDRPATTSIWDGDDLLVGGEFRRAGNVDARGLARLSAASGRWQSVGSGVENGVAGVVRAIAVHDGKTYVGGDLVDAGGQPDSPVRQFDPAVGRWVVVEAEFGPRLEGSVRQIIVEPGGLLVGGELVVGPNRMLSIAARWSDSAREWTSVSPVAMPAPSRATSLLRRDGELFAAGVFPAGGFAVGRTILRLDATNGTWVPVGLPSRPQPFGRTVQIVDGSLWLGGRFDALGLAAAAAIVSLDGGSAVWVPVAAAEPVSTLDPVAAIVPAVGQVVVAGRFSSLAGVQAANIVRREAGVWRPLGQGIDEQGRVESAAANRSRVVVAGSFGSAGGLVASNVSVHDLDPGFRNGFEDPAR